MALNAIKLEPKSAAYLDTIGWIYYKMDDYDEALRYIRESLSIDSNNATIQSHLDEIIKNKAEINTQKIQQADNLD
jgi:tetratricopeptide (TPR) repeat protein